MTTIHRSHIVGLALLALVAGAPALAFADGVATRSEIFGAILEKISAVAPEHAAALQAINDAMTAESRTGSNGGSEGEDVNANSQSQNSENGGATAGDGGDGGDGGTGLTILLPSSFSNSGGGGNGGDGGSAAEGGLIRSGFVTSNSNSINMTNTTVIRVSR